MLSRHARLMHHLHRLVPPAAAQADAELLDRYVRLRDEAAFAALVRRHASMVLGVCRRILVDFHTAEDAFQATFMALARQADAIRRPEALTAWLYGTAQRIAWKAQAAGRRVPGELLPGTAAPIDPRPDPLSQLTARELLTILDEEIQCLPEAHRMAVILCCLEGKSSDEAALQLGCTTGSLRGRLVRGRALLHARLLRRGLTFAAALSAAEVARSAAAATLVAGTIQAGLAFAGTGEAAVEISTHAARLAGEVVGGAGMAKAKLVMATLLLLGVAALGAGAYMQPTPAESPAQPKAASEPAPPMVEAKGHVDREGVPLPVEAVARVGSARMRPGDAILGLAYASGDKTVVSIKYGNTLQLWDATTGKLRDKHVLNVDDLTLITPFDGKTLHFLGGDSYRVYGATSGKEKHRVKVATGGDGYRAAVSPDGSVLAIPKRGGGISLIDPATGAERRKLGLEGEFISSLAFSPDGKTLAAGSFASGLVRLIDSATGAIPATLKSPIPRVLYVAFAPNGKRLLISGLRDETPVLILWDLASSKELWRTERVASWELLRPSAFSPDGKHVAIGGGSRYVGLYEVATGKEVQRFRTYSHCEGLAYSSDGKTLMVATHAAITQWNVDTGKVLPASADPPAKLVVKQFTDDGKHLLAAGTAYTVYEWQTGQAVHRYAETPNFTPDVSTLSPDRRLLAYVADATTLVVADAKSGKERFKLRGKWREFYQSSIFTRDSQQLVTAHVDGDLQVWDVVTGKRLRELKSHTTWIVNMVLSSDGRRLATVSINGKDNAVRLWDLQTGVLLHRLLPERHDLIRLAFSADGTRLAIAAYGSGIPGALFVIDVTSGEVLQSLPCGDDSPMSVAFSPNDRMLVAGYVGGVVSLWELATGKERHRFEGQHRFADGLAFSPDGTLLASSSLEAPILVWDIYGTHLKSHSPPFPTSVADRQKLWLQLADADASIGFQAVRRLVRNPTPAVGLVRDNLKPAEPVQTKLVKQWLAGLDSDDFEMRQAALAKLDKVGDRIEALLRDALAAKRGIEAKRRVQTLLDKFNAPTPERAARWRAMEALEQNATPDGVRLLESLAAGEPGARLTREATAVLDRLRKR